jgi:hypothetical protein
MMPASLLDASSDGAFQAATSLASSELLAAVEQYRTPSHLGASQLMS